MAQVCPKCGMGQGRLASIVRGVKTYRFDCCSPSPPSQQSSSPMPDRRHAAKPANPSIDPLERALNRAGVKGGAINAERLAESD